jgi:hypothetical protein
MIRIAKAGPVVAAIAVFGDAPAAAAADAVSASDMALNGRFLETRIWLPDAAGAEFHVL